MSNSTSTPNTGLSYKDAGVDIEAGDALVDRIKSVAKRTARPEVMGGLGGFGALCKIPKGYEEPVLVSGTDGVGTKLRLALNLNRHDTIGQDLVAMCVNDLLVCGAEPLFFLDYYATGHLNVDVAANVVTGIGKGCELSGCALVGGETAEMPGMYEGNDYDLAGFCVGVVEQSKIIDGTKVKADDVLIGVASSGAHSNGYSLLRKLTAARLLIQQWNRHAFMSSQFLSCLSKSMFTQWRTSLAAVYQATFHAFCQMALKLLSMSLLGNGQNCSNCCKKKAVLNNSKCTAHLTAA